MTATALPSRRTNLILDRGVLEDPQTGDFYTLGPEEAFLFAGLDGRQSADELAKSFETEFGEPLSSVDLEYFIYQARERSLLAGLEDETTDVGADPVPSSADTLTFSASDTAVLRRGGDKAEPVPARRSDLVIRPSKDDGSHVVKDPVTGQFFELGPEESFLLLGLDGAQTAVQLMAAFEVRFGSALTTHDVTDFVALARSNGFIADQSAALPKPAKSRRQTILYWRTTVCDPDRFFTWLEPKLRFLWTRTFFALSAAAILLAACITWSARGALVDQIAHVIRWDVLALAWVALVAVTALHECGHGLTCKHYGGEVREVGFLMMFLTPCFFCNVSDAWLFKERSKRLWVTFAGGYCDLVMWALAVFAWRVLLPGTLLNHLAWVVLTVCGGRILFNFNPLMKLDGYYLLGDACGLVNLQRRGLAAVFGWARCVLWGARRPATDDRGRAVLAYGLAAYLYRIVFLSILIVAMARFAYGRWGYLGLIGVAILARLILRNFVTGLFAGEVRRMIATRRKRLAAWLLILGGLAAAACLIQIQREAAGPFLARPVVRAEIFAPVAGFLREVPLDEGDRVTPGTLVVRLEIPDLNNKLAQKRNEVVELTVKAGHCRTELDATREDFERAEKLAQSSAASLDEYRMARRKMQTCEADLQETEAKLSSAKEEVKYLEGQAAKLTVLSPVPGLIMTPRLKEKVGQFVHEGDLICVVEDPTVLRAEIKLPEQEVERVRPGERVELKARALPFDIFTGTVERMAPGAAAEAATGMPGAPAAPSATGGQNTVTIYVELDGEYPDLRPGMTGHARVQCGKAAAGRVLGEKVLRFIRTEFWW
jgi:multidrug resistance efflux pump